MGSNQYRLDESQSASNPLTYRVFPQATFRPLARVVRQFIIPSQRFRFMQFSKIIGHSQHRVMEDLERCIGCGLRGRRGRLRNCRPLHCVVDGDGVDFGHDICQDMTGEDQKLEQSPTSPISQSRNHLSLRWLCVCFHEKRELRTVDVFSTLGQGSTIIIFSEQFQDHWQVG